MLPVSEYPIHGTLPHFSSNPNSPTADALLAAAEVATESNRFGALVTLYHRNDFLSCELKSIKAKLIRAREYLESPACNPSFAIANLRHLRAKHAAILTMLRANRREAEVLLRAVGPDLPAHLERQEFPNAGEQAL